MNLCTHITLGTYKVVPYFNTITLTIIILSFPAMFAAFSTLTEWGGICSKHSWGVQRSMQRVQILGLRRLT